MLPPVSKVVRDQSAESGKVALTATTASSSSPLTNNSSGHSMTHEQDADSNLRTLLEFKKNLFEEQKSAEKKIDEINSKLEAVKKQIDEERVQLDKLRTDLKKVNEEKDVEYPMFVEVRNNLIEARNQMKNLDDKVTPAAASKSRRDRFDMENLTKTLAQIERDIQTKKLSKDEERKLVTKSKEIATRLHTLKIINKKEGHYRNLSSRYDQLKEAVNKIFKQKEEYGSRIGRLKESLDGLLNLRENLYEERRTAVHSVREATAKLEMVETQLNAIAFRKTRRHAAESRSRKQKESEERRLARQEAMQEKAKRDKDYQERWNVLKEAAMKKMSGGEKLTFDEMKLIFGDSAGSD